MSVENPASSHDTSETSKSHTFSCPDVSADLNETLECVDPFMFMAPLNH